ILSENRTAGQASLRADDVVFPHHAGMSHLHQAIDLGAPLDARFSHRRAIDGSERLYLHVIFNHRHARLYDLEVRSFGSLGESKAIASHHHSVLQDHAIAHAAVFAHHGMRMSTKIVADLRALVDHRMRVENSISAN